MINAFIFDLDGVIIDTAQFHFEAWNRLAGEFDFQLTHAHNEQLKGVSRVDSLERILKWAGKELSEKEKASALIRKNEWYMQEVNQLDQSNLLPGSYDFLKDSKEAGLKIALGSSSKNARIVLEKVGIIDWFDAIVDGTNISHSKPHPEVFLNGAEALQLDPSTIVVFEDAHSGIEAAQKGGFHTVGIGRPGDLSDADVVFSGLSAITPQKITAEFKG